MRNRFEDSRMGHKILVSPVDGIKSHFKTSYSLTVKLLETRNVEECQILIEKGFGAYLLQQKEKKRSNSIKGDADIYREIFHKYSLKGARDYLKLARRLEKEKRNGEYLEMKLEETGSDLVNAIADYMPMGIGLLLKNDQTGFFLGDVKWGIKNNYNGFGVVTKDGAILVVGKEHIRAFAEPSDCLPTREANLLLDVLSSTKFWEDKFIKDCKKPILLADPSPFESEASEVLIEKAKVIEILSKIKSYDDFPLPSPPGSLVSKFKFDSQRLSKTFKWLLITLYY